MKKYIICISLIICSTLTAMNNADQRPVQFAPAPVLFHRLEAHDKKYSTQYAQLALRSGLHEFLNDNRLPWSYAQSGQFIESCIKAYLPHLSEPLKHKREIMSILRPELVPDKPAKL